MGVSPTGAQAETCIPRACTIGVYLTGVHLMGVHLTGVHLIGVYLMGVSTSEGSDAVKVGSRLSTAARSAAGAGSVVDAYDLMLTTRGDKFSYFREPPLLSK
jgi:hypothetical protein